MNLKNCVPVLFVKDARKSKDFYTVVLGMSVMVDYGGLNYMFKEGFSVLQIMDDNIIPEKLGRDRIGNSQNASRFELCFETEDLDSVYETLKENKVKFLHEMNTELWGQHTVRFYDPDGHLIEAGETMSVFLKRIYNEEGQNIYATSRRTFVPVKVLKHYLNL